VPYLSNDWSRYGCKKQGMNSTCNTSNWQVIISVYILFGKIPQMRWN